MISELYRKAKFDFSADRIGPDCPFTHWKLYLKNIGFKLCKDKLYKFGHNAEIRPGAYLVNCSTISIGNRVVIRPGTMLFGDHRVKNSIVIEDDAMLGSGVHIYVSNHRFDIADISIIDQGHYDPMPVKVSKGAWIGANSIILPGVTIGENSVVGAGSVVTRDVLPRSVVVGCPAELKKVIE